MRLTYKLLCLATVASAVMPLCAAQAAPQEAVLKPLSSWLVGPSQPLKIDGKAADAADRGCSMITEYENGMILGFHARKEGVIGLTVDVRREAYSVGQTYRTSLSLAGDSYTINAVANTPSTLSLDLRQADKAAQRLTGLLSFRLQIDRIPHFFSTAGYTEGLKRLQDCMGGVLTKPIPVAGTPTDKKVIAAQEAREAIADEAAMLPAVPDEPPGSGLEATATQPPATLSPVESDGKDTPIGLAPPMLGPQGYRYVLEGVNPTTQIAWQAGPDWQQVVRDAIAPHDLVMAVSGPIVRIRPRILDQALQGKPSGANFDTSGATAPADGAAKAVWVGAKGQKLSEVLAAWGAIENVNIDYDLKDDPVLDQDIRVEGSFDEALKSLLNQTAGADKPPVAVYQSPTVPEDGAKPAAPDAPAPATADKPAAPDKSAPEKAAPKAKKAVWRGLEGAKLSDVLKEWGRTADVDVLWLMDQSFELKKTIKFEGTFEEAVVKLLAQFEKDDVRPVAQLNRDPDDERSTLIVRVKGM